MLCNTHGLRFCFIIYAGHFIPEEDDKFLERVRAAVEEEERQVIAAAATDAAKDAIATAEEFRKTQPSHGPDLKDLTTHKYDSVKESKDQIIETENNKGSTSVMESGKLGLEGQGFSGAYDSVANLPLEFYHYYHGSNTDMGTLIEVSFHVPCKIPLSNSVQFS